MDMSCGDLMKSLIADGIHRLAFTGTWRQHLKSVVAATEFTLLWHHYYCWMKIAFFVMAPCNSA
jgi:hypothetical protein